MLVLQSRPPIHIRHWETPEQLSHYLSIYVFSYLFINGNNIILGVPLPLLLCWLESNHSFSLVHLLFSFAHNQTVSSYSPTSFHQLDLSLSFNKICIFCNLFFLKVIFIHINILILVGLFLWMCCFIIA